MSDVVYHRSRIPGAVLFLFLLIGCGRPAKNITAAKTTLLSAVFTADAGWDIYPGGGYRYGPSIIRNADGSIDAWFAAPGGSFDSRQLLYSDPGTQSPLPLSTGNRAAQQFTAGSSFYAIAVACPNWNSTNSSITLTLYQWNTDYATTVAGTPVAMQVYTNYADNQNLQLAKAGNFPAGAYLWLLSNPSGTAGVWEKSGDVAGVNNYVNGQLVTGNSFQSFILSTPSSGLSYWDQAAYRRTTDDGKTWSTDQMVLKPTLGSRDQLSVCDPGLVKAGNYYYVGYTSTEDTAGVFNHAYVARSTSPTGPWQKWNGSGWGGNPQPVITFTGNSKSWGAGEPCMVVNNDTLFFYYTWNDVNILETRVATVNASDTIWPAHVVLRGTAVDKSTISGADHCDIKYRADLKKYYAIHTAARLTVNSYIVLWESADGISFTKIAEIRSNLKPYLHNCGWSGDEKGHIDPSKRQYLSYAYGPDWGNWKTAWHPISFQP